MAFPNFTLIADRVFSSILTGMTGMPPSSNVNRNKTLSQRFPWIRIFSGAEEGLILQSANLDDDLGIVDSYNGILNNLGDNFRGSYGNSKGSGPLGKNFNKKWVYPSLAYQIGKTNTNTNTLNNEEQNWVLRPSPVVTALEIKEGKDQISRVGSLVIKCFSLVQLEEIQKYFMEPGFSILIEYGWNTDDAYAQLIDTTNKDTIIKEASNSNLNQTALHKKRFTSRGDYDSFFAFIVGASVNSENDNFSITINLRGMPGLPTYLQSQHNINKLETETDPKTGNIIKRSIKTIPTVKPYNIADIEAKGDAVMVVAARRYKYMFNSLPPQRQTLEIVRLVNQASTKKAVNGKLLFYDLIGFDLIINQSVDSYKSGADESKLKRLFGLIKEFKIGSWTVPKEKLGSNHKYIRFGLALKILNSNNGLISYKYGNKSVNVRIDETAYIGAFPKIFSTDPTKLIIPGKIPDFFKYYLNDTEVPVNEILNSEFDTSLDNISFVQNVDLPNGLQPNGKPWDYTSWPDAFEKSGYYGLLENLYINFDVFKMAIINSANKSIKDVLLDMLNEMSNAVNSFWNFQLVEKINSDGDIVIGIIDENWSGKSAIPKDKIQSFRHAGELSVFLDASLEINVPAETANQIILKRENYTSQPNAHGIDIGRVFTSKPDLFFTKIEYSPSIAAGTNTKAVTLQQDELTTKKAEKAAWLNTMLIERKSGFNILTEQFFDGKTNELIFFRTSNVNPFYELQEIPAQTANGVRFKKLNERIKELESIVTETKSTALNSNINKIDIIANPQYSSLGSSQSIKTAFESDDKTELKKRFRVYCCNDTQLFDIIKNNAFESYGNKTSILLPIKYSFTIMGKSGIRRGDVFNIIGIPERYAKHGYFQVINIEQQIEGNLWTTKVIGQYRQDSSK